MAHKILVLDDEAALQEVIASNLRREGHRVLTTISEQHIATSGQATPLDLAIVVKLDLLIPGVSNLDSSKQPAANGATEPPILVLVTKAEEADKIMRLELNADDRAQSRSKVLACIRVQLHHDRQELPELPVAVTSVDPGQVSPPTSITAGPVRIDPAGRKVWCRGKLIPLQYKQFELLLYLVQNRGVVLSRDQLLQRVWGYDYDGDTRTVDVHIRWLREKLEENPATPTLIQTVRGVGYCFRGGGHDN